MRKLRRTNRQPDHKDVASALDTPAPQLHAQRTPRRQWLIQSPLSSCQMVSDDWIETRQRVDHESVTFKLGIQHMQQTDIKGMLCSILDPLNLQQFAVLDEELRDVSCKVTADCVGEREQLPTSPRIDNDNDDEDESCSWETDKDDANSDEAASTPSNQVHNGDDTNCLGILSSGQMAQLRNALPCRFEDAVFRRIYCLAQDGDRLDTLLFKSRHVAHTITVIETTRGDILGGYCAEPWSGRRQYHGNGQSFLFASRPDGLDNTTDKLHVYPWTGRNDYCQVCDDYLAMGGQGSFGWRICSDLMKGQTGRCQTYENRPLVHGGFFEISNLELFAAGPLLLPMNGMACTSVV